MTAEQAKANREKRVFLKFLERSGLPVNSDSVLNRSPREPDILCRHNEQGFIAFELAELCEEQIARKSNKGLKARGVNVDVMCNDDPTKRTILKKLKKNYTTAHPIKLLCYTDGFIISPDDQIIEEILHVINSRGPGSFRRVWLLGEEVCQIIFEL
jgi:hypothetical protein